jgi:hypothetical protein
MIEVGTSWKCGGIGVCCSRPRFSHASEVRMFAAGSLRFALDDAIAAYTARTEVPVVALCGPSGKLRQMIESGDVPGQFGPASLDHAAALKHAGVLRTSEPFTRSGRRLMAAPGISVERGKVVEVMLDPALRLGTATPKSYPAGDSGSGKSTLIRLADGEIKLSEVPWISILLNGKGESYEEEFACSGHCGRVHGAGGGSGGRFIRADLRHDQQRPPGGQGR